MLISCLIRSFGQKFLHEIIDPVLHNFIAENRMNVDASSVESDKILYDGAVKTALEFIESVKNSLKNCPLIIRQICNQMYACTATKFPGHELKVISGVIFLRFICPGILSSNIFGIF